MKQIVNWNAFSNPLALLNGDTASQAHRAHALPDWAPVVDIIENDSCYVFRAELPGVRKADIDVWVEQGVLHVAGERKADKEEKNLRYHRIERSQGVFARSFALPEDANANAISAQLEEGVLTVTVDKAEQAKPRKIEIKIS